MELTIKNVEEAMVMARELWESIYNQDIQFEQVGNFADIVQILQLIKGRMQEPALGVTDENLEAVLISMGAYGYRPSDQTNENVHNGRLSKTQENNRNILRTFLQDTELLYG